MIQNGKSLKIFWSRWVWTGGVNSTGQVPVIAAKPHTPTNTHNTYTPPALPSSASDTFFLAAEWRVAQDQEGYEEKKDHFSPPPLSPQHTHTHIHTDKYTPPNTRWCFWNLFPFFPRLLKKWQLPRNTHYAYLHTNSHTSFKTQNTHSWKDEYQLRRGSQYFTNKQWWPWIRMG